MITTIATTLTVCVVYGLIYKGWVKSEIQTLNNRINAGNSEARINIIEAKNLANNAKAIASNALSSAQRAEAKFMKHIEEITKKEETNA